MASPAILEELQKRPLLTVSELSQLSGYSLSFLYKKSAAGAFAIKDARVDRADFFAQWDNGWPRIQEDSA
jgi:hypothetical protein